MANILVIDDDESVRYSLSRMVRRMGHACTTASTLREGIEKAASEDVDVVFLDVRMPDGNGLDALPAIRRTASSPEVIIITGYGDPDGAELALKSGAWDYMEKGSSVKQMSLPVIRALQFRDERNTRARARSVIALKRDGIVGTSGRLMACLDQVASAAQSEANVLVAGETGTGKELFARAIHENSPRATGSFVVVDCAALPETLVESLLFGHEKGAFTGADKVRQGLIRQADGGTLFLDEVGELPMSLQKAFLRVLQEHRFRPLGSARELDSNFRLVAATNRDLDQMVGAGVFRQDLLYRLKVVHIRIPALRERREDIRPLIEHILARSGRTITFTDAALSILERYRWPGNVRELQNIIEQIAWGTGSETIDVAQLPTSLHTMAEGHVKPVRERRRQVADDLFAGLVSGHFSFWEHVHKLFLDRDITRHDIRELVRRGLAQTYGNYRATVKLFGLPEDDYKRFLNFLDAHECRVDYRPFRKGNAPPPARPGHVSGRGHHDGKLPS